MSLLISLYIIEIISLYGFVNESYITLIKSFYGFVNESLYNID